MSYFWLLIESNLAWEQALHLGLTRDLFGSRARFGREPREDWGGGEVLTALAARAQILRETQVNLA